MLLQIVWSLCVSVVLGEYVVDIDEDNFYQVVLDRTKNVLVEFYSRPTEWSQTFAPAYEAVAATFKDEKDCVVARVNVNAYRNLGMIYEYRGFPKFYFFASESDNSDGELYEGERIGYAFVNFLNERCGTSRLPGGAIDPKPGRLPVFDALAKNFMNDVITKSEFATADEEFKESGNYYVSVMKKILEEGEAYLATETSRLEKLLEEYMTPETRRRTQKQLNILKVFKQTDANENTVEEDPIINEPGDAGDATTPLKGMDADSIIFDAMVKKPHGGSEGYISSDEL